MMMTVLHANDTLNVALRKWDLSSPQDEEFNASLPGVTPITVHNKDIIRI
jgi:hypothetical protein